MSKNRTLLTQMLGSKSVLSQARQKALLRFAKTKPLGAISLVILLIVVIVAIFREPLAPYDPLFLIPDAQLTSPNAQYWMGTDNYGDISCSSLFPRHKAIEKRCLATNAPASSRRNKSRQTNPKVDQSNGKI